MSNDVNHVEKTMKVGPVLRANEMAEAIIEAIQLDNSDRNIEIIDRGGYIRVQADDYCIITKKTMEEVLGREFRMPGELEVNLSSFIGRINPGTDAVEFISKK
ncbi:MmoB/DmpM family protein [Aneurinibacillus sp. UBA3580]|jgi:toluene monooxygenase system protein D|uniref:MmoB/DmpM family protein n=1 Tax=Aneurinibacillus sp. UBA3580 TaxID=1946041 RepID=UPI00257C6CA0|nr:MmoB/DmpM family protein [Aneurinibacillus sp. UBA3580]